MIKTKKKQLDELEKFLKKKGISGIFHIPKIGIKSLFKEEGTRLRILDYALLEIEIDNQTRMRAAQLIVDNGEMSYSISVKKDNDKKQKEKVKPVYVT